MLVSGQEFSPVSSVLGALRPVHLGLSDYEYVNLSDFEVPKENMLSST